MRFSKKTILLAACLIISMTMTSLATVAYLSDRDFVENTFTVGRIDIKVDESVVDEYGQSTDNTGKRDVTLADGTVVSMTRDEYRKYVFENKLWDAPRFEELPETSAQRTEVGNKYKLVPGMSYVKDPTMTVTAGSESAYLRMVVTINNAADLAVVFPNGFLPENFVADTWKKEIWPCVKVVPDTANDSVSYYFNYYKTVDLSEATEDLVLEPLFTQIEVPANLMYEQLDMLADLTIKIEGQAIQTAAFTGENAIESAWSHFDIQYEAVAANP